MLYVLKGHIIFFTKYTKAMKLALGTKIFTNDFLRVDMLLLISIRLQGTFSDPLKICLKNPNFHTKIKGDIKLQYTAR